MRINWVAMLVAMWCVTAAAATIEQPLNNPLQEQQARTLFTQLKCVVCEGQSLADSDAKLAIQMRARIREMLAEGKTPAAVQAFFRTSYGERILMLPPVEPCTALLWLLPFLVLGVGVALLRKVTKSARGAND